MIVTMPYYNVPFSNPSQHFFSDDYGNGLTILFPAFGKRVCRFMGVGVAFFILNRNSIDKLQQLQAILGFLSKSRKLSFQLLKW